MNEVYPSLIGISIGIAQIALANASFLARSLLIVVATAGAVAATYLSAEYVASWWYVIVDLAEILIAATLARFIGRRITHYSGLHRQ
jgi:hypothetical protein